MWIHVHIQMSTSAALPWSSPYSGINLSDYFSSANDLAVGALYRYLCRFYQLSLQAILLQAVNKIRLFLNVQFIT